MQTWYRQQRYNQMEIILNRKKALRNMVNILWKSKLKQKFKEKVCNSDAIEFLEATGEFEKETNIKAGRSFTCNGAGGSVGYRVKRNVMQDLLQRVIWVV